MTQLFLKLVDFVLGGLLERRRKKKVLSEQFKALKRHIIHEKVENYFPVHLAKLRTFLLDSGLVDRPEFREFFDRWLTNPFLVTGRPFLGMLSNDEIAEMKRELSCLRL